MATDFGILFYGAIKRSGWSANRFARIVGTSSGYLSGIYSGARTPPLNKIEQWADLLQLQDEEREEFILSAHLEHSPDFIKKLVHEQRRELGTLSRQVLSLRQQVDDLSVIQVENTQLRKRIAEFEGEYQA